MHGDFLRRMPLPPTLSPRAGRGSSWLSYPLPSCPLSPLAGRGLGRGPPKLKSRARTLRQNATDPEKLLWRHLRDRQVKGYKFRRQHVIDHYIADFVCASEKLVVELDGGQHAERTAYDEHRTRFMESKGYRVARFWNNDVLRDVDSVLEVILRLLEE